MAANQGPTLTKIFHKIHQVFSVAAIQTRPIYGQSLLQTPPKLDMVDGSMFKIRSWKFHAEVDNILALQ